MSKNSKNRISVKSGSSFYTLVKRPICFLLEIEDLHFNLNSAVYIPEERLKPENDQETDQKVEEINNTLKEDFMKFHPELAEAWYNPDFKNLKSTTQELHNYTNLSIFINAYNFLKDNQDYLLLIVGHTDTSGKASYNQRLSEARARCVEYILKGDEKKWSKIVSTHSRTMDVQKVLAYFSERWGWDCDPGSIDDIEGKMTRNAVKCFQNIYNEEFNKLIKVDGIFGPQTWKAVFTVYMRELDDILGGTSNLEEARKQLRFVDNSSPSIGCGEKYPIDVSTKDNYMSEENRRVDLLFFKRDQEPKIQNAGNIIYESKAFILEKIKIEDGDYTISEDEKDWGDVELDDVEDELLEDDELMENIYESEENMEEQEEYDDDWENILSLEEIPSDINIDID